MISEMVDKKSTRMVLDVICVIILAVLLIGRLMCGVHWLTDIMAGTLLSLGLLFLFKGVIERQKESSRGLRLY